LDESSPESDSLQAGDAEDESYGSEEGRVIMEGFVVQVSGFLPPHSLDRDGRVSRQTVLGATVRDQAALYGFLGVLNDLGLELVDLRQLPRSGAPGEPRAGSPPADRDAPLGVEVVIRGSVGDLAVYTLGDHVEVTHLATRLLLSDRLLLGQVLDWARTAGAVVEYAADTPSLTNPPEMPTAPRRSAPPGSPVEGDAPVE
jgi:hypothetical protein